MNIKSVVSIEITKDDRKYSFNMEVGSPFGEAYDAAFDVLQHIVNLSKQAADSALQVTAKDSEKIN